MKRTYITQDLLRKHFKFNPKTGSISWLLPTSWRVKVGDEAGSVTVQGYRTIRLFGTLTPAHWLMWFNKHGYWPTEELDHKNGNRQDNRLRNLREGTKLVQSQNQKKYVTNTSGHPNVSWNVGRQRWMAYISIDKRRIMLGQFKEFERACTAAKLGKAKYHAFQPIHRDSA